MSITPEQYFPDLSNLPFISDRAPSEPLDIKTTESLAKYNSAFINLIKAQREALRTGDSRFKSLEGRIGQITGKMWSRSVEGVPINEQVASIAKMDFIGNDVEKTYGVNCAAYIAGFKGEFASGAMLDKFLDVYYPSQTEDMLQKTDWAAYTRHKEGEEFAQMSIQTKTIALPQNFSRINQTPLPILSSLATEEDLIVFERAISLLPSNLDERKQKLLISARAVQKYTPSGILPIMCLLGSPESPGSDIVSATARPTTETSQQAFQELSEILESSDDSYWRT